VSIQLNIVTRPTYPEKFARDNVVAPFYNFTLSLSHLLGLRKCFGRLTTRVCLTLGETEWFVFCWCSHQSRLSRPRWRQAFLSQYYITITMYRTILCRRKEFVRMNWDTGDITENSLKKLVVLQTLDFITRMINKDMY